MPRGMLIVFTSPSSAAEEDEYNRWYDEEHLPDVMGLPGFVSAIRYRVISDPGELVPEDHAHGYLALYEMEAPDLAEARRNVREASQGGRLRRSDTVAKHPVPVTYICEEVSSYSKP
jgi:hypothetical protein